MTVRSGRSTSAVTGHVGQGHVVDHVSKDMWQTTSARTCDKDMSANHVDKDMWHSQIMTSVKMKSTFQVRVNHESE
jgi:hypothetical protein